MSHFKTLIALFIISICLTASFSQAQMAVHQNTLAHNIDSLLESQVRANKIPGAVIEVKIGDDVILKQAYGYALKYDYRHHLLARPDTMTVGTLFDIASLTKVVGTTTSIMLLADREQLSIDDPVSKYIKAFAS